MQLHYVPVGVVMSDIIDANIHNRCTIAVNNYNIRTEPRFLNRTGQNLFRTKYEFFEKPNKNRT